MMELPNNIFVKTFGILSAAYLMKSHDINIFMIPFDYICSLLNAYGIEFDWGEKEKEKAFLAWEKFNELSKQEQDQIGSSMIQVIEDNLIKRIEYILDDTTERKIERVALELVSNLGEVKVYEFGSVENAIEFLQDENLDSVFITGNSLTLFEPPPQYD